MCYSEPRTHRSHSGLQASGFIYSKGEMLEIYKAGHFRDSEFSENFQHVQNATTPEKLVPLSLLPMDDAEREQRLQPIIVPPPAGAGGRGGGRGGYQDREGGRGRGKGGKASSDSWGERGGRYNNSNPEWAGSGDARLSGDGGRPTRGWGSGDARGPRDSGNSDTIPALPAPQPAKQPPPQPKECSYRDLQQTVQGPFIEALISEWFAAGFLPMDLNMRSSDDPPNEYIPLSDLSETGNGEPPFVRANRLRQEYEAEQERLRLQPQEVRTRSSCARALAP